MFFNGLNVITSIYLTEAKEMLVHLPCGGGWVKHVLRVVQVPKRDVLQANGVLYMHPAIWAELKAGGFVPLHKDGSI